MHSFSVTATFPVSASTLYNAWLDGELHAEMTGGGASCTPEEGSEFTAWDGYIWGTNLKLEPNKRIVQSWRTSDFLEADDDSRIEIEFTPNDGGCAVTLHHSHIPEDHPSDYEQGWEDHYFAPMRAHFGS